MSGQIPSESDAGLYWRDHLRDRLALADDVIANLAAYRTALAIELELGTFVSVAEPADTEQVNEMVRALLNSIEWDKLWSFLK